MIKFITPRYRDNVFKGKHPHLKSNFKKAEKSASPVEVNAVPKQNKVSAQAHYGKVENLFSPY